MHLLHEDVDKLLALVVRETALPHAEVCKEWLENRPVCGRSFARPKAAWDLQSGSARSFSLSVPKSSVIGRVCIVGQKKGVSPHLSRVWMSERKTRRFGVDAAGGDIERQLALRDTHSADSEITETEDARTVRNDLGDDHAE